MTEVLKCSDYGVLYYDLVGWKQIVWATVKSFEEACGEVCWILLDKNFGVKWIHYFVLCLKNKDVFRQVSSY